MATGPDSGRHERVRAKARTHFDKWALSYDRSILNEVVFFPSVRACQEEIELWKRARPAAETYALLDVGCGTGTFINIQARDPLAARVVGLDYSPVMAVALVTTVVFLIINLLIDCLYAVVDPRIRYGR